MVAIRNMAQSVGWQYNIAIIKMDASYKEQKYHRARGAAE